MQSPRTRRSPKDLFPFIPEESGSDTVAVQKLIFYLIMIFQKCRESQVINVIMVSSVQKQVWSLQK